MASRNGAHHLRVIDMRDREVLALVEENADESGWASAADVAAALWPRAFGAHADLTKRVHAVRAVGVRLAWMRRYGVVERAPEQRDNKTLWGLTPEGVALLNGKLNPNQSSALKTLKGSGLVLAMHSISERDTDDLTFTLMRRAFRYGTAVRG